MNEVGDEHEGVVGTVAHMRAHTHLKDPNVHRSSISFKQDQKSNVLSEKIVT